MKTLWRRALGTDPPEPDCFRDCDFDHVECPFYSTCECPIANGVPPSEAISGSKSEPLAGGDDQLFKVDGRMVLREIRGLIQRAAEIELSIHGAPAHFSVVAKMVRQRYPDFTISDSSVGRYLSISQQCTGLGSGTFAPRQRVRKDEGLRTETQAEYEGLSKLLVKIKLGRLTGPYALLEHASTNRLSKEREAQGWEPILAWRRFCGLPSVAEKDDQGKARAILRWLSRVPRGVPIAVNLPDVAQLYAALSTSDESRTKYEPTIGISLLMQFGEFRALLFAAEAPVGGSDDQSERTLSLAKLEACVSQIRHAQQCARNRIAERHLRLVFWVAERYPRSGLELDDRVQEGNIGLLKAVERFDPEKGYTFATYATYWIRQAITRAIADSGRVIPVPVHRQEAMAKAERKRESSAACDDEHEGNFEAIEDAYLVGDIFGSIPDLYLERFSEAVYTYDDEVERRLMQGKIDDVLHTLTPHQRRALNLRFGLEDGRERTLEEVKKLGVTRERVRQIEEKALKKLRHPSRMKFMSGGAGAAGKRHPQEPEDPERGKNKRKARVPSPANVEPRAPPRIPGPLRVRNPETKPLSGQALSNPARDTSDPVPAAGAQAEMENRRAGRPARLEMGRERVLPPPVGAPTGKPKVKVEFKYATGEGVSESEARRRLGSVLPSVQPPPLVGEMMKAGEQPAPTTLLPAPLASEPARPDPSASLKFKASAFAPEMSRKSMDELKSIGGKSANAAERSAALDELIRRLRMRKPSEWRDPRDR